MNPTVSIIVATYNRSTLIPYLLDSIQNQTLTEWECIIINDWGNDDTDEVVEKYVSADNRFTYHYRHQQYKKGLPGCRNYGLDLAKGKYVVFFDDDDIVHPELIKTSMAAITSGDYDFCHYQKQSFTETKKLTFPENSKPIIRTSIDSKWLLKLITYEYAIASCTALWKKSFLTERFNEDLQYAEEWEYYNRLFIKNQNFTGLSIDNILYFNRKHPKSNTSEYYDGNPIRISSKSLAAVNLLSTYSMFIVKREAPIISYLLGILIRNRSFQLYKAGVSIVHKNGLKKILLYLYFLFFPMYLSIYKEFKNIIKTDLK